MSTRERPVLVAVVTVAAALAVGAVVAMPAAHADNSRLNNGVVANVYTVQQQAGCTNDVKINQQLRL
ncbi:MAG TPA: CAP domain-containing protein, partial [Mycobacterium sp.]|nr:CAP domain-containing protein [Mycobacterium sp.]